ncbi:hypothetical protein JXB02_00940 [Candidatus Woesearchaeota archaeon]|nr:hypothetical protein [Candidatus Woesearchaeota archaeon]
MADENLVIETGVDRLVSLVNKRKKISIQDAAKQLGLSVPVIEEWADFLEEEGIISLEYKFATTYLVERKLTKKEVEKKAKEFHGKKDAFVRKAETTLSSIEHSTEGLDEIREQFLDMKKDLGLDLKHVEEELKELENLERLKKEIDSQMSQQKADFRKKINEMDAMLDREHRRYEEILDEIATEKIKLEEERSELLTIKGKENELKKKLDMFKGTIDILREKIDDEEGTIGISEKHIQKLEDISDRIRKEVDSHKQSFEPMVKESKAKQQEILDLQKSIVEKVMQKRQVIENEVKSSHLASDKFKRFFNKKNLIERLIRKLTDERDKLEEELQALIKKAHAFNITTKSADVKKHIAELSQKFKEIDRKKGFFESEIGKLTSLITGAGTQAPARVERKARKPSKRPASPAKRRR